MASQVLGAQGEGEGAPGAGKEVPKPGQIEGAMPTPTHCLEEGSGVPPGAEAGGSWVQKPSPHSLPPALG